MLRLDWLKHHMAHSDTLAQWLHQQFHYEYADVPLSDWQHAFAEGQHNGQWQCLVALDGDRLLGSAALASDDLPGCSDLGPWLACVFVAPEATLATVAGVHVPAAPCETRQCASSSVRTKTGAPPARVVSAVGV